MFYTLTYSIVLLFTLSFFSTSHAQTSKSMSSSSTGSEIQTATELLSQPTAENLKKALSLFEDVLLKDPNNIEAHMGIVNARILEYFSSNQEDTKTLQEALKHVDSSLRLNPKHEDAYNKKSQTLFYLEKKEDGLNVLKNGLKQMPSSQTLHEAMLTYLINMDRIEEATRFSRLPEYRGENPAKLHLGFGFVWFRAGKMHLARESFISSKKIKPSPEAWDGIGMTYMKEEKWKEAIESFNSAIKLDSKYYDSYYDLAICYSNIGKIEEALQWLLSYTKVFHHNMDAMKDLALLYEKKGDDTKARLTWMKIRSMAHNRELRDMATEHIDALGQKKGQ
ncbi:MAG: tetratricopeptide repeat protein [Nitrospirae bacterium]|nr:tetratricopeptide repeat protein [Nitrospirota bacterium]